MPSMREMMKQKRGELVKRHEEQMARSKESHGFGSLFDKSKMPDGIEEWRPKKGQHLIDVIPFFAGPNHPRDSEGEISICVDMYVHMRIGPASEMFPCPKRNFGQRERCAVCEAIQRGKVATNVFKAIAPKRRVAYLVWVHDTPEEEAKGLQVWEVSHFFFEKHIDEITQNARGGGAIPYADIETGKSVAFSIKQEGSFVDANNVQRDSMEYVGHRLVDRDATIPDKILNQIFSLDTVINMRPDQEIMLGALQEYDWFVPVSTAKDIEDINGGVSPRMRNLRQEEQKREPEPEPEPEPEEEMPTAALDEPAEDCADFGKAPNSKDECDLCEQWTECVKVFKANKNAAKPAEPKQEAPKAGLKGGLRRK